MGLLEAADAAALAGQRAAGTALLACALVDGRTRMRRLYQEGAAKIRLPAVQSGPLEAVLINTAGGLTGGDRLDWQVEVGPGAEAVITTQACEKIYRSAAGRAETSVRLTVGAGGRIAWLPQESIVFDRSAFARRLEVDMATGSEALVLEATLFGRRAMGEQAARGLFHDRWRVRCEGRLVHADELRLGPRIAPVLARPAVAGGGTAVAALLMVSPRAEGLLEAARTVVGDAGGVSAWSVGGTGKLLARLAAEDGYALRRRLMPLVQLLNGQAGLPKLWSL